MPEKPNIEKPYELWFDPNEVGADLVVECWISHGPMAGDPSFDPQSGELVLVGDDDGAPVHGRVVRRDGNRVWVQLDSGPHAERAMGE